MANKKQEEFVRLKIYDYKKFLLSTKSAPSVEMDSVADASKAGRPRLDEINQRIHNFLEYIFANWSTFPKEAGTRSRLSALKNPLINILYKYTSGQRSFNDNLRQLLFAMGQKLNELQAMFTEQETKQDVLEAKLAAEEQKSNELATMVNHTTAAITDQLTSLSQQLETVFVQQETIMNNNLQMNASILKVEESGGELNKQITNLVHESHANYPEIMARMNALSEMLTISEFEPEVGLSNNTTFYSQFGEDKWIVQNLKLPQKGTFVDVGAADGITYSNTYYFEKLGWNGICLEPDPRNYIKAKKYRKNVLPVAITNSDRKVSFTQSSVSPDWSGLSISDPNAYKIEVEGKRLQTILENANIEKIDLLSIDTEGTEIEVWDSFDYKQFKPKIVIMEFNNQGNTNEKILELFKNLPYTLKLQTKANYVFELNN